MKLSVEFSRLAGKEYVNESVTPHEGAFLMALVGLIESRMGQPLVVEIGSWIGVSTIYFARAIRQREEGRIVTIDPHTNTVLHRHKNPIDTEALLRENLKRFEVEDLVEITRDTSRGALQTWEGENIDLLFIDGAHWFKNVREDFAGWSPWVLSEGLVVFHDYPTRVGVKRTVDEIVRPSGLWEELGQEQKLIAFRRRKE